MYLKIGIGIKNSSDKLLFFQTRIIVHPYLHVIIVKYVHAILRSFCKRNQSKQDLQRHLIRPTESDHNYILEKLNADAKLRLIEM